MATAPIRRIVRAYSVPARVYRLQKLADSIKEIEGLETVKTLYNVPSDKAVTWAVPVNQQSLAILWSKYQNDIKKVLKEVAEKLLGKNYAEKLSIWEKNIISRTAEDKHNRLYRCKLSAYLNAIADLIAYMLRYPLIRDPLAYLQEITIREPNRDRAGQSKGSVLLLAPHQALLLAKLSLAYRVLGIENCYELGEKEVRREIIEAIDAIMASRSKTEQRGEDYRAKISTVLAEINKREISEKLEALFYAAPADTRPGLNSTSLLLHLLLVSAGAASAVYKLIQRKDDEPNYCLDVVIVRLAGLLHDIGKFVDFSHHVRESRRLARSLLEGIVPEKVLELVEKLISAHHSPVPPESGDKSLLCLGLAELHGALRYSDHVFTGMDRLTDFIEQVLNGQDVWDPGDPVYREARNALLWLGEELAKRTGIESGRALELLYRGSRGHEAELVNHAYYELLLSQEGVELVRQASESLARLMSRPRPRGLEEALNKHLQETNPLLTRTLHGIGFGLVLVDIGGVQKGISESFKLRSMAGFSLLVDYVTLAIVPYSIVLNGSPLEAIVFSGGGTVHAIVALEDSSQKTYTEMRRRICEAIEDIIGSDPIYGLSLEGLQIRVSVTPIDKPLYSSVVIEAYKNLQPCTSRDERPEKWLLLVLSGIAEPCSSCGLRPAIVDINGEPYCPVCAARYMVSESLGYGDEEGYRRRILDKVLSKTSKVKEIIGRYQIGSQRSLEVLGLVATGLDRNYAIVKSDGNSAGLFMASSLTPTMYFERSIRLDMATKNTIAELFENIISRAREKEDYYGYAIALVYGYMYAGGDDSLLIVPARLALPIAAYLGYGFSAEMGFLVTLSTGIVAAPVKHNIWWSIDAATTLLDEVAKSAARPDSIKALLNAEPAPVPAYVAFDYTDGWGLNSARALARYEKLSERGLSIQPLPLISYGKKPGLIDILVRLAGDDAKLPLPSDLDKDRDLVNKLNRIVEKTLEGKMAENASNVYRIISRYLPSDTAQLLLSSNSVQRERGFKEAALILAYASARHGEEKIVKSVIDTILQTYVEQGNMLPLHDVYLIYKFMRGD